MTTFVELAHTKNAAEFQTQLETSMSAKVATAIAGRKTEVATAMFGEVSETPAAE